MPADRLRVEYQSLAALVKAFEHEADDIEKTVQQLTKSAEALYASGWHGRGADAFFRELGELTLPATSKLSSVLQQTGETVTACMQLFWDTDQEVGRLFSRGAAGEGAGQGANNQAIDPNAGVKEFWSSFLGRFGQMGQSMAQESLINAALGPLGSLRQFYGLGKSMAEAYQAEGGGFMGVLGAANELNPVSHLMRAAYQADAELEQAFYLQQLGDHEGARRHFSAAGEHFADTTVAAVETGAAAAGGAKMLAPKVKGVFSGVVEPSPGGAGPKKITISHGTNQAGFEGVGGVGKGKIDVRFSPGEHQDFGQGFYLSQDVSVAESAAMSRSRGGMQHVLQFDVAESELGKIVDIRRDGLHRAQWESFLDESPFDNVPKESLPSGMQTNRDFLSGMGIEQRGVYFEKFLKKIGMSDADTVVGPIGDKTTTGAVGSAFGESTQIVIRSQTIADRLNQIMNGVLGSGAE
jgi:WXG100 family type VII secretion target